MTTLIGIKTNVGEESIILASDTQLNYYSVKGEPIEKRPLLKIVYGEYWALAQSGADTNDLRSFFNKLRNPKDRRYKDFGTDKLEKMINVAVDNKRFMEICELNAKYVREEEDVDQTHEFIMAVNKPKMELYHVDIFGNLKTQSDRGFVVLGSTSDKAESYLDDEIDKDTYHESNIDISRAVQLLNNALKNSNTELLSGLPMDLVIIRKNEIRGYGKRIKDAVEFAERKVIEEIVNEIENPHKV